MTTIDKYETKFGKTFLFRIKYDETIATIEDNFSVIDYDGVGYGYERRDELTFFPSKTSLVIDDFHVKNYNNFKSLINSYNQYFPFNFEDVLTITIFKNGIEEFSGIVHDEKYDRKQRHLTLELTDASELYKRVNITNYFFLEKLIQSGFSHCTAVDRDGNPTPVKVLGYSQARVGHPLFPGAPLILSDAHALDDQVTLKSFFDKILSIVNPNKTFVINHDWLFGSAPVFVTLGQLYLRAIYSNYLGRFLLKPKSYFIDNLHLAGSTHDHAFNKVYDDGTYEAWEEQDPDNKGLSDKNVISIFENLCQNFFGVLGFESFNKISLNKKANRGVQNVREIMDKLIGEPTKESYLKPIKYVDVFDHWQNASAFRGIDGELDQEEDKLKFEIIMSSYSSLTGSGFGLGYNDNGVVKAVVHVRDPITGYTNRIHEQLAESEYNYRKVPRDKHSIDLWDTNHNFTDTLKYQEENNEWIFLRPMTLKKNEKENRTKVEAINIGAAVNG